MPLRLIFMGTPHFAVPTLAELAARGHDIAAVYTRAPKPGGRRGLSLQETPVALEARRLGIPVRTPATLKTIEEQESFRALHADAAVVVAYGLILPKPVLDAVPRGCFNLHASLLPRWRGAAPINRAIMAGDPESGVAVMRMEEGLDTGPVAMTARVTIDPDMTAGELHDALAARGAPLMADALAALERDELTTQPQSESGITYAAKIDKNETRIDWAKPWQAVHNHIRGLSPSPAAWCDIEGARVRILRSTRGDGSGEPGTIIDNRLTVACADGAIRILELQREGKRAMMAEEYTRGTPVAAGTRLS
jgi:methionyl-tRNA formyltransferase